MRTIAVIPARYHSTRLPGKPLVDICGRPMIELVYRRALDARLVDRVLVAADDTRVRDRVLSFGGECVMTSPEHPSGTDRVAEAAADLDVDVVVNVQGDEPLLDATAIDQAVAACDRKRGRAIASLRKLITSAGELWDPNVVKVVTDRDDRALYFSRWPIPFLASSTMDAEEAARLFHEARPPTERVWYKHVGLYAYPKHLLLDLTRAAPSPLERLERLEQLRALEHGVPIVVETTEYESFSVDTPADLERVRRMVSGEEPSAHG